MDDETRPEKLGGHRVRELIEEGRKWEKHHSEKEQKQLMDEREHSAMSPHEARKIGGHRVRELVKEAEKKEQQQ